MLEKKEEKINPENTYSVAGGISSNKESLLDRPRDDVLAFSSSRRNLDGMFECRACKTIIEEGAVIHKCVKNGIVYNVYKLTPDKNIWRKE